jgi:hypothetical protein
MPTVLHTHARLCQAVRMNDVEILQGELSAASFITKGGAAEVLGVSTMTVLRMLLAGQLTAYWPRAAKGERRPTLLSYAEVLEVRDARVRLGRGRRG